MRRTVVKAWTVYRGIRDALWIFTH